MKTTTIELFEKCPICGGNGWTAEHDPYDPHENGICSNCPIQVQCENCKAVGFVKSTASLSSNRQGWTRVEDGLPEVSTSDNMKPVLVNCIIGITSGYYWGENNDPCKGWSIMNVTHWMPLPNKPI